MSVMRNAQAGCPSCGSEVSFGACFSVNADLRPDMRAAILDGSFQRVTCEHCGQTFRLEPEFTYLEVARGHYIQAHPASSAPRWAELEHRANELLAVAYGQGVARTIGEALTARVVFGWAALIEKLICQEAGIDDVDLELVKMAIMRSSPKLPISDAVELRMIEKRADVLRMVWLNAATEAVIEFVEAPASLLEEVSGAGWQPLREAVSGSLFVDINRILLAG